MLMYDFGMVEALAIAMILLILGKKVKEKINILEKYFIPAPVIGGFIFSVIALIGRLTGMFEFSFTKQCVKPLALAMGI